MLVAMNEEGIFEEYDDTYDVVFHCKTAEERDAFIDKMQKSCWITDREPTDDEVEYAGDCGFILCISGTRGSQRYDHAIVMDDNYYEEGRWYLGGTGLTDDITVHGWMLPPAWEEVNNG